MGRGALIQIGRRIMMRVRKPFPTMRARLTMQNKKSETESKAADLVYLGFKFQASRKKEPLTSRERLNDLEERQVFPKSHPTALGYQGSARRGE